MKLVANFISAVQEKYSTGAATELTYRSALEAFINGIAEGISALNEPKRVECGAPDFIVYRGENVIGHVEAKDIGIDIRKMTGANKEQQQRYRKALPNLIYTNCLDWDFYRNGECIATVSIADFDMGVKPIKNQYEKLFRYLSDFAARKPKSISDPLELAEVMAGKANLIKTVLRETLTINHDFQSELNEQYQAFEKNLIHEITYEDFADIYAETIAYGMFAARLHDNTPDTFCRQKALELLPESNPFLRSLFRYLAGYELDDRIAWIVDDLASVFQVCDVVEVMKGFGKEMGRNDPFLHFYETFLAAYNPDKRKVCGVWYTPEPVVDFIVRAVDEVLKTEFHLPSGLADTSRVTINCDTGKTDENDKPLITEKDVHRVQILDPATGTGTFLAAVIKRIEPRIRDSAPGMWPQYIEQDLIRRLHGFELLMASYAMCHLKLDMILTEMGYKPTATPPRFSVYLTNSLEEGEPVNKSLPFARWLTDEARGANRIKRDMPIMCVIGNPPYLGEGGSSESWIDSLMEDYKKEPGGQIKLKERNPRWLNDLYVKFIRLSSNFIEKNGEGILGFVTNHGYLDNPTFRGMRWHLLRSFDRIWILDLHGNANREEDVPKGKKNENVFDIKQGVSIIIAVRKKDCNGELAQVKHGDLWGDRMEKFEILDKTDISAPIFSPIEFREPQYPFVKRDYITQESYEQGIPINQLMPVKSIGVITARDRFAIDLNKERMWDKVRDFVSIDTECAREKYELGKDAKDWKVDLAQKDVKANLTSDNLKPISYRPFDTRWTYYTGKSNGFMCRPRFDVMWNYFFRPQFGILTTRQVRDSQFSHVFVTRNISDSTFLSGSSATISMNFPLYLYPKENDLDQEFKINFNPKIFIEFEKFIDLSQTAESKEIQVFDFIYGSLQCQEYLEYYDEFLKIDFPRIPIPTSETEFLDVSEQGKQLRHLHLMDTVKVQQTNFTFSGKGDGEVDKPNYMKGKIWINNTQCFDNVPLDAWEAVVGGYRPAQKWLKDRKGETLNYDDVSHFQRIIGVLLETGRIMDNIYLKI